MFSLFYFSYMLYSRIPFYIVYYTSVRVFIGNIGNKSLQTLMASSFGRIADRLNLGNTVGNIGNIGNTDIRPL